MAAVWDDMVVVDAGEQPVLGGPRRHDSELEGILRTAQYGVCAPLRSEIPPGDGAQPRELQCVVTFFLLFFCVPAGKWRDGVTIGLERTGGGLRWGCGVAV